MGLGGPGEEGQGDGVGVREEQEVRVVFQGCFGTTMKWCRAMVPTPCLNKHPGPTVPSSHISHGPFRLC